MPHPAEFRAQLAPARMSRAGRGLHALVVGVSLCWCITYACAKPAAEHAAPGFAVRAPDGKLRTYRGGQPKVENELLQAAVEQVGDGFWELTLTPKTDLTDVWFPWPDRRGPLKPDDKDEILLYPNLMGIAYPQAAFQDEAWKGVDYPGQLFAPLAVTTDSDEARLDAALNWPPRRVHVFFCLERVAFVYRDTALAGATQHYRWLTRQAPGDPAAGVEPWQAALDVYKAWLLEHMRTEGLYPLNYPDWLLQADGWLDVQLENMPQFDAAQLAQRYQRFKDYFPWVQFWGQMSNYSGPQRYALPPLKPDEQTGCCLQKFELHPRYLPDLPRLIQEITRDGRVGFYARPHEHQPLDGSSPEDKAFLFEWLSKLSSYGANAFYVDTLGGRYYGEPLKIAHLVHDELPPGAVIEFPVDIYPAAHLISGCLFDSPKATPGRELKALRGVTSAGGLRFERFGRYLLDDRALFLGEANTDYRGWGPEHEYETERRAFLLGAKLDVAHPAEGDVLKGRMNVAVHAIVSERRRIGWWQLRPVYRDRQGIRDIPEGVDVRRFRGQDGQTLLVFDNWRKERDLRIIVDGREVPVPEEPLAIRVLADKGAAVDGPE